MTVSAHETLAIVVGIERYHSAIDPHGLDGPVPDACRFVDWLLRKDVPPANITLLTAPLPENEHLVEKHEQQGVRIVEARAETIRRRLITELPAERSELLFLVWGGHGVIHHEQRKLVFPDTTSTDPRNFNLSSFVKYLRTITFKNHPRQQLVIDTCSIFAKEPRTLGWKAGLSDERFHGGAPFALDQQVYLASSDGESARNSNARKTGYFSEAVLHALDELPERQWPPDLDTVRDTVNATFGPLRTAGTTTQIPSAIWYKGRSSEEEVLIFSTDHRSRHASAAALGTAVLDETEYKNLCKILRGTWSPPNLAGLHREVSRSFDIPAPRTPGDLRSAVDSLRRLLVPEPLFEFLVRLASCPQDTVAASRLWAWIRKVGPRYNVDLTRLEDLAEQLRRTYLLVKLQPAFLDPGYEVTIWRYVGDEGGQTLVSPLPWDRAALGQALSEQLVDHDPNSPPVVEFLIPTEMVEENFEQLPVTVDGKDIALGLVCPVVVRPLERRDKPHWREAHEASWLAVAAHDSYDHTAICWLECVPTEASILHGHVCVVLAYTPTRSRGQDVMGCLFDAGTPIAVWHRAGRDTSRSLLDRILLGQAISELPDVVHEHRCNYGFAAQAIDHPARDLVLLWDDPTRRPDEQDWRLPASMEGTFP